VPVPKLRRRYARTTEYSQMPEITIRQIRRFFEHDKDLEPGKWVKVIGWSGRRGRAD
jgi:inorganic pyrophosphatase